MHVFFFRHGSACLSFTKISGGIAVVIRWDSHWANVFLSMKISRSSPVLSGSNLSRRRPERKTLTHLSQRCLMFLTRKTVILDVETFPFCRLLPSMLTRARCLSSVNRTPPLFAVDHLLSLGIHHRGNVQGAPPRGGRRHDRLHVRTASDAQIRVRA